MHIQKNIYVYVDLRMCTQKIIERYIIWENMAENLFAKFNSKNIVKQLSIATSLTENGILTLSINIQTINFISGQRINKK